MSMTYDKEQRFLDAIITAFGMDALLDAINSPSEIIDWLVESNSGNITLMKEKVAEYN